MSQPEYVTLPQLEALIDRVERAIDTGFKGVHHRQDVTNGRVGKNEVLTGKHDLLLEQVSDRLTGIENAASVASHAAALAAGKAETAAGDAAVAAVNAAQAAVDAKRPYALAVKVGSVSGGALIALYELWQRIAPWLAGTK